MQPSCKVMQPLSGDSVARLSRPPVSLESRHLVSDDFRQSARSQFLSFSKARFRGSSANVVGQNRTLRAVQRAVLVPTVYVRALGLPPGQVAPLLQPRPHRREQRTRTAHQRQHDRRVLRRIRAPGLRLQRPRPQKKQYATKRNSNRFLHNHPRLAESIVIQFETCATTAARRSCCSSPQRKSASPPAQPRRQTPRRW